MSKKSKEYTVVQGPMYFFNYLKPQGWMEEHPACHALLYYAMIASKNVIEQKELREHGTYEGEPERVYNYKQLFLSCATLYGVSPEEMTKYWSNVDMQMWRLGAPRVPKEEQYRFNTVPEIRSH